MGLKVLIIIVFVALLIGLGSGLVFLFKDQDAPQSRRTWNSLSVRLALAALLMGLIIYGTYEGKLRSHAPWDHQPSAQPSLPQEPGAPGTAPSQP